MKFFKPKSKLRKPMFQKTPIETQFLYSTIYSNKQYQQKSHKNSLTHKDINQKKITIIIIIRIIIKLKQPIKDYKKVKKNLALESSPTTLDPSEPI